MSDAEAIAVYCRAFQAGVEALRSCEFQALLSQPLERGNQTVPEPSQTVCRTSSGQCLSSDVEQLRAHEARESAID